MGTFLVTGQDVGGGLQLAQGVRAAQLVFRLGITVIRAQAPWTAIPANDANTPVVSAACLPRLR